MISVCMRADHCMRPECAETWIILHGEIRMRRSLTILGALLAFTAFVWSITRLGPQAVNARITPATQAARLLSRGWTQPHRMGRSGKSTTYPAARPDAVLYDQYDNPSALGTSSQLFGPPKSGLDSQGADDFIVPPGHEWAIKMLEVDGLYDEGGGPADSVNVYFYTDAYSLPGTPVYTQTNLPYMPGPEYGQLVIPTSGVTLPAGHYWLSVQVNQSFSAHGQWYWQNRTVIAHNAAAWRNPADDPLLATGCADWKKRDACGGEGDDHLFRLSGSLTTSTPSNR
jgi:hypothetical protein